ncbi:hypothetical protein BU14_0330s0012 [Porphyra umbilicalis]|uniref:Uncharacterized protein n=1 Tax=Porphyra umbilicalis TaxID=2786 RepID=A0A1X6NYQ4_PORUM|nr:hypothetical protein BU14_0330s0012 [Porphyra umbilicalis]|eukprot:OSX73722.1 hypothetical protein BU14_0330s0012 [Porphyra umbilicalis]
MDQGIPLYRINSHGSASPISRRATPVSNPRGHPNRVHSAATAPACCSTTCQPRGAHGTLPDGRGNTPPPLKGSVAATTGCRRRGRGERRASAGASAWSDGGEPWVWAGRLPSRQRDGRTRCRRGRVEERERV